MADLKEGAQSLWSSYVPEKTVQEPKEEGSKSGTFCQNIRLKNGELTLALARRIMMDCYATVDNLSDELGVTVRSVKSAMKKIRDKLSSSHLIPGLNEVETENLARAMAERDNCSKKNSIEYVVDEKAKEAKEKVMDIIREFVVERMIQGGSSVVEIAETVGLGRKRVRQVMGNLGYTIGIMAKEMMQSGHSVWDASKQLSVPVKEIKKALLEVGYHVADTSLCFTDSRKNKISMIKPGKPKSSKTPKKAATISSAGLAEWNMMHYDKDGKLRLPPGCRAPSDLPKRYPSPKSMEHSPAEPRSPFLHAPPLSEAECSARGRKRIGYMRLF